MPIQKDTGIPSVVGLIDSVMKKYGQKGYYDDPKFHISIASWKYNDWVFDRWNARGCCSESSIVDMNTEVDDSSLLFVMRGIHCDFGTVEKHYIPFGVQ